MSQSLEEMKKDDLVKLARTLTQNQKILEQELTELKEKMSEVKTEAPKAEMNLEAVTLVKVDKNNAVTLKVKFNLEGDSEVTAMDRPKPIYKALNDIERAIHSRIVDQADYSLKGKI